MPFHAASAGSTASARLGATGRAAGPCQKAHQIESALQYLDGDLQLSSSFSNGEPTQGAVVRLLNADGTPGQELGRTDADGRLNLDLSSVGNGTVDLQVDGGPGHRDYLELPVQDGEVNLNEVVVLPFSLVMVGLLVSVRRRTTEPRMATSTGSDALDRMVERLGAPPIQSAATSTCSGWPRSSPMPAEEQTDDIKVKGCVSQVFVRVPSMRE